MEDFAFLAKNFLIEKLGQSNLESKKVSNLWFKSNQSKFRTCKRINFIGSIFFKPKIIRFYQFLKRFLLQINFNIFFISKADYFIQTSTSKVEPIIFQNPCQAPKNQTRALGKWKFLSQELFLPVLSSPN